MKKFFFVLCIIGIVFWGIRYSSSKKQTPNNPKTIDKDKQNVSFSIPKKLPLLDYDKATDGISLYQQGKLSQALVHLKKEYSNPEHMATRDRSLAYIATIYGYLKQTAKAQKYWDKLLKDFPQSKYSGDAYYFIAKLKDKEGLKASALKLKQMAVPFALNSIGGNKAAFELGEYFYEKKELQNAWLMYSKTIRATFNKKSFAIARKKLNHITKELVFSKRKIPMSKYHRVQPGDNLTKISNMYDTSIGITQKINGKKNAFLRVNEELKIIPGKLMVEVRKKMFFLGVYLQTTGLYIMGFDVGLGRDDKTPVTTFKVVTKKEKPDWYKDGRRIPYGDPRNVLGQYWMGFNNRPGISGFGIHGTVDPGSIGKNMSDGCIRLRNEPLATLFLIIPRGTTVDIKKW